VKFRQNEAEMCGVAGVICREEMVFMGVDSKLKLGVGGNAGQLARMGLYRWNWSEWQG